MKKRQKLFTADGGGYEERSIESGRLYSESESDREQASDQAFLIGALLGRNHRRPGIVIGSYFFSVECLMMAALLVCTVISLCRSRD